MPDSVAPTPIPVRIAPPPAGYRMPISAGQGGQTGFATASLVLGIVSVIFNILLLPTILAIVFGALALGRATAARRRAIAGIVLGGLGIFAIAVQAAIAIPVYLSVQNEARATRLDNAILNDSFERGSGLTAVDCPATAQAAGDVFTCVAQSKAGRIALRVTITDANGGFTYTSADSAAVAG